MEVSRVTAPYNCDSVEVNPGRTTAFVGMYQYEESTGERGGGYLVLSPEANIVHSSPQEYGCLDAKWISDSVIGIACSDGIARWIDIAENEVVSEVGMVANPSSASTENIIMTIDTVGDVTSCITAKGKLGIIRDRQSLVSEWEAHSPVIESWCCGLSPTASVVVTGSDDCSLKYWDVKTGELIHCDKRNHRMGTTCIEFLNEHTLLSGSYDERIRKFDMRYLSVPLEEVRTIGGVWRLKPHDGLLFVAACYGGCQILDLNTLSPVLNEYKGHDSMAYGIDYFGNGRVVSCSFYDKSIQFWPVGIPS